MPALYADVWGPEHLNASVLIHGSFATDPAAAWAQQRALAARYRLIIPHRLGYGNNSLAAARDRGHASSPQSSLAADVQAVGALLEPAAHVVGFSYGGLVALAVAATRASRVQSLVLIEPPLYGLLRGDAEADALIGRLQPVYDAAPTLAPTEFYYAFVAGLGQQVDRAAPLPAARQLAAQAAMQEAVPWNVHVPYAEVATAPFPKVVISGGWNPLNERLCDTLAQSIGGQHAVAVGAGHGVQRTGSPFNTCLEQLWQDATGDT